MNSKHQKFSVGGMSCASCVAHVDKAVRSVKGVKNADVNLLTKSMVVEFDPGVADSKAIIGAVEGAGYEAQEADDEPAPAPDPTPEYRQRFWVSAGVLIVLMVLAHLKLTMAGGLLQLAATAVIAWVNRDFFTRGFKSLFRFSPNMDSLVALGASAGILYSIFELVKMAHGMTGLHLYFEASGMILTLITLGKFLEAKATGRTGDAIARLIALAPPTVLVERGGKEQEIALRELVKGDVLIIKNGAKIPADGVIIEGSGALDESAVTGESVPRDKGKGDRVYSGSINREGFFKFKADKVGAESTLGEIIRLVEAASGSKAPIAKLADRIAGVFVPVVIAIAVVSAAVWLLAGASWFFALTTLIAVLLISCPCALGLATPVAIMVGVGKGAQNGILFKTAEALELAQSVKVAVVDKTGTLTTGVMELAKCLPLADMDEKTLLAAVAAVESASEHPISQAIVRAAKKKKLKLASVEDFHSVAGEGVNAEIDGLRYYVGNPSMLKKLNIAMESVSREADKLASEGHTVLVAMRGETVVGLLALADAVKPDSAQAVAAIHALNVKVVMLTGDNERTAAKIAGLVGVDEVYSGLLPQDKTARIVEMQKSGLRVAMIGDGVNDAPSLAQADVGIAVGAGTDVAISAADVVLVRNSLLDAASALELSRAVMRNIRENLFWAFFYNALGIPLAAGVFYSVLGWQLHPVFGAAAMSLSSVCVVGNALRLRFFKPSHEKRG